MRTVSNYEHKSLVALFNEIDVWEVTVFPMNFVDILVENFRLRFTMKKVTEVIVDFRNEECQRRYFDQSFSTGKI